MNSQELEIMSDRGNASLMHRDSPEDEMGAFWDDFYL